MRVLKSNILLNLINSYLVDSPQPSTISYNWNYGSILGVCLIIQLVSGLFLSIHYNPDTDIAFTSVEIIIRDVNYGWLLRYVHANTASLFFVCVYLHISRGLYYTSYKWPRVWPWEVGVVIFILLIGTGFLGYTLVYGQISLWGATVITSLLSAIPWVGTDLVEYVWGGFSVNTATINRFYSLHFLLPFVLAGLVVIHFITFHENGSSNPLQVTGNIDRLSIHPYFTFKDMVTVLLLLLVLCVLVGYNPNLLGHADNYVEANPIQTPISIVPEWYLLPFYAILRSIPNKLLGVVAIFGSLLILILLPWLDKSVLKGLQFKPLSGIMYWLFVCNFVLLFFLGSKHVEDPYIVLGQISTAYYFGHFLVLVPLLSMFENYMYGLTTKHEE